MAFLRVAGAQLNFRVGDIEGNTARILETMEWAAEMDADILLFPELAVTGYPPEDLLLRRDFVDANLGAIDELASASGDAVTFVGFADRVEARARGELNDAVTRGVANAAAILCGGERRGTYHKILLPNYGVFDEDRYFLAGSDPSAVWYSGGAVCGVSVCEDIWVPHGPPAMQAGAGAQILLNINASPYHFDKGRHRQRLLAAHARTAGVPLVYLNMVGGQDELVFDGQSMVFNRHGELTYRAPQFEEQRFVVEVVVPEATVVRGPQVATRPLRTGRAAPPPVPAEPLNEEAEVYRALQTGLADYVVKNGFGGVVIGLSGGIDSSLTAAIAVDALGPESVWGVAMPSPFNSPDSLEDAQDLAKRLGCRFDVVEIDAIFQSYLSGLADVFANTEYGVAEENIQARVRGTLLMALSNKYGHLLVTTGNKSEMAVGYATLYGDMAGGFSVLKDVFKGWVYKLAEWRNSEEEVIPPRVLEKPPSAELRPGQKDTDSLPPYDLLDRILRRYVEEDRSVDDIVAAGFEQEVVREVAAMVDRNEYKRRQAPPGVRISNKAFGKDRRLPITNAYQP